jgi:hypothetical protein
VNEYTPENRRQDTKEFLRSQLGADIMSTLIETAEGHLSKGADMTEDYPERYIAKYAAVKEVIDLINQPLDDD